MQQAWDDSWDALGGLLFIALTALVVGFFIALFVGGVWLIRALKGEGEAKGSVGSAPRAALWRAAREPLADGL